MFARGLYAERYDLRTLVARDSLRNRDDVILFSANSLFSLFALPDLFIRVIPDKTELLWFGPASQRGQLPSHSSTVHVSQCVVKPVTVV